MLIERFAPKSSIDLDLPDLDSRQAKRAGAKIFDLPAVSFEDHIPSSVSDDWSREAPHVEIAGFLDVS